MLVRLLGKDHGKRLKWGAGILAAVMLAGAAFSYTNLSRAQIISSKETSDESTDTFRQLSLFGDVLDLVSQGYVETVDESELIEAAINGMLASLDPHSSYLNPRNFADVKVQTKGEFGGLGIEVTMENGVVKVVSPIDDTPAYRAGIKPGDLITHLDGEPILGMTLGEAVEKMRGKVGTDIMLTVRRKDQDPMEIAITRDIISIQAVRARLEDDVGYVRITAFNEKAYEAVKDAVVDISEEAGETGLKGWILDLRNNPGGLLEQAVDVSDAFLERGEILSTRGRNEDETQRFNARPGDITDGLPIIVLINGGSASASEIVAGALQDHNRAIVMGMPSFGKGSVQTIIPMGDDGAVRLTTARYYTPSGRSIQAKGIEPDIQVEDARIEPRADINQRREADLKGALDRDEDDIDPSATPERSESDDSGDDISQDEVADNEEADYQLFRALDLLRGLAILNKQAQQQSHNPLRSKTAKQGG